MKRMVLKSFCGIFFGGIALVAAAEAPKKSTSSPTGDAALGKIEYQTQCAGCHDGAAAGPLLTGMYKRKTMKDKKRTPVTDASVRHRITAGGEGMPPFVSLKTKQLDNLIAYLKTL
jgi:mono/diheme cytochrome c family protein